MNNVDVIRMAFYCVKMAHLNYNATSSMDAAYVNLEEEDEHGLYSNIAYTHYCCTRTFQ